MVSPEVIGRYSFFAGFCPENIIAIAKCAKVINVAEGYCFFREGEELKEFFLVAEGAVGIFIEVPDNNVYQPISTHLTGNLTMKDVLVSTIETGDIFAWSALIPPFITTASAKALMDSKVISFDCAGLAENMEDDPQFSLLISQKAAQVIRDRLRDLRIETLEHTAL